RLLAKHCDRDLADLERDTDRDNYMSADEAKEYGLIDQVLENRASLQA
ncbi:ATP-dependent Clp protease proteolytic subunit, partial [Neisseria sp. P0016.S002]